jgi:hypothetical protein
MTNPSPAPVIHDPFAAIMLELALLMTMVMVAHWLTDRYRQPAVLGELLIGVLVGNLGYWLGVPFFSFVMNYGVASPLFLAYPVAPCRLDPIGYSRAIWRAEVWTMVEREV